VITRRGESESDRDRRRRLFIKTKGRKELIGPEESLGWVWGEKGRVEEKTFSKMTQKPACLPQWMGIIRLGVVIRATIGLEV